jgi:hypothetical protein
MNAATTAWASAEQDPERIAILAAADRLLAGKARQSTGNLSVVQLAAEAGVKYWTIAQKHTDLRDHFQQLTRAARHKTPPREDEPGAVQHPDRDREKLARHCAALEELIRNYAAVINELATENQALRDQIAGASPAVTPLRRRPTTDQP